MQDLAPLRQTLDSGTSLAKGHRNSGKGNSGAALIDLSQSSGAGQAWPLFCVERQQMLGVGDSKVGKTRHVRDWLASLRGASCTVPGNFDCF